MARPSDALAALVRAAVRAGEVVFASASRTILPRLRSRTGYANPRVRHYRHRLGFAWHTYRCTKPNLAAWLADRRPIFPHVVQVQTINRCNAACEF